MTGSTSRGTESQLGTFRDSQEKCLWFPALPEGFHFTHFLIKWGKTLKPITWKYPMAGCYQRDSKVWITSLCKCSVTFRLLENRENSSLPFFSVLEQDLEVGGHILPSGTVAVLCHMTMQHNPEVGNSFFRQGVCNNLNEQILKLTSRV